jgi:hypothetical protein
MTDVQRGDRVEALKDLGAMSKGWPVKTGHLGIVLRSWSGQAEVAFESGEIVTASWEHIT